LVAALVGVGCGDDSAPERDTDEMPGTGEESTTGRDASTTEDAGDSGDASGTTGTTGGEAPLAPGEVGWSVEVGGPVGFHNVFDVADDGTSYLVRCAYCPQDEGASITVRDPAGAQDTFDNDCGETFEDYHAHCHVLGLQADGGLALHWDFRLRGTVTGPSFVQFEADAAGLVADFEVGADGPWQLQSPEHMLDETGNVQVHLELSLDGDDLSTREPPTPFAWESAAVRCTDYDENGNATFRGEFPVQSSFTASVGGTMMGHRCLGSGQLLPPGISVAGRPLQAPNSEDIGFLALLDESGAGPLRVLSGPHGITMVNLAAHEDRAAFAVSYVGSGPTSIDGVPLDAPDNAQLVVQVDELLQPTATTVFKAELGPPDIISAVSVARLVYGDDGRLALLARVFGRMREYAGSELVTDHADEIANEYFLAEVSTETGRLLWVETPFVGDPVQPTLRLDGPWLLHQGFVDQQPFEVDGETFSTPGSYVYTLFGF
jgi:hypothetical protein